MMIVNRRNFFQACLAVTAGRAFAQGAPRRIRALSYNIHHGEGMDRRVDLPRIAGVITSVSPDVVMLQEVDRRVRRTGGVDQLAELSRLTSMPAYWGKTIDLQDGEYGNGILTRLPIAEHSNLRLPGAEPRAMVSVRTEDGMWFLATHFDVGRTSEQRVESAARINQWMESRGTAPAILAGDFNDVRGSRAIGKLAGQWAIAGKEIPTIPVVNPKRQIDFILFRPAARWRVVEVKVLDEQAASDHRPIFGEFELL